MLREKQTLGAVCSKAEPKIFAPLQTPFPGKQDPLPSIWPHLFCGAGHEKRRGEQLKWSLYIGSFVFHVHSYQDQFIQPS